MTIAVILLISGLAAGLAKGGKLENLGRVRFRQPWLVFVGMGIQIGAELTAAFIFPNLREDGRGIFILATSYVFLISFVILNRGLPGWSLIVGGLALNLLVIAANGGMPVSQEAARAAGFDARDYLETAIKHRPLGPGTRLSFLGDIIPIPVIRKVVSIGDVFIGVGLFLLVERLSRYTPRRLIAARRETEPVPGQ